MKILTCKLSFGLLLILEAVLSFSVFADEQWVSVEPAMHKINITGFTRAKAKMPLISEVSGKVVKVFAAVGDSIPESGYYACLDDTFVSIDIKTAQSEISKQYVDINYFKKEVSRHETLVKKHSAAVSLLDGLVRDLKNARSNLIKAKLEKERLEELQERHCVKAPSGWLVIERSIEPGQWINEGQVLGQVGNYKELLVPVALSQHELSSLKSQADSIQLYFPDLKLRVAGTIEHISPAFDEKTRKVMVDILIKEFPLAIHGGMRVDLELSGSDRKGNSFLIPKRALEERYEEFWLEKKDGKRIRVQVMQDFDNDMVSVMSKEIEPNDQFKVFQ